LSKEYSYSKWAIGAYSLLILFPIVAWVFLFKTGIQNMRKRQINRIYQRSGMGCHDNFIMREQE
jgi:hypothetical protein